jgi:hypothetical protein
MKTTGVDEERQKYLLIYSRNMLVAELDKSKLTDLVSQAARRPDDVDLRTRYREHSHPLELGQCHVWLLWFDFQQLSMPSPIGSLCSSALKVLHHLLSLNPCISSHGVERSLHLLDLLVQVPEL